LHRIAKQEELTGSSWRSKLISDFDDYLAEWLAASSLAAISRALPSSSACLFIKIKCIYFKGLRGGL
jgi:hypothetical protein